MIPLLLLLAQGVAAPGFNVEDVLSCAPKGLPLCALRADAIGEAENANPWWDVVRTRGCKDESIEVAVSRKRGLFDHGSLSLVYRFSPDGKLLERKCLATLPVSGDRVMDVLERGRVEGNRFVAVDPCRSGCLTTRGTRFEIDAQDRLMDPQPYELKHPEHEGCARRVLEVKVPPVKMNLAETSGTVFVGSKVLHDGDVLLPSDVLVVAPRTTLRIRFGGVTALLGVAAELTEVHFVPTNWGAGWPQVEELTRKMKMGVEWVPPYIRIGSELWRMRNESLTRACAKLERAELATQVMPGDATILMGGFFEAPEFHAYSLGGLQMDWCLDKRD